MPQSQCTRASPVLFCSLLATRGRARRWAAGILVAEQTRASSPSSTRKVVARTPTAAPTDTHAFPALVHRNAHITHSLTYITRITRIQVQGSIPLHTSPYRAALHCWRGRISCPQCASLDHHFQVPALRVYRTPVSSSRALQGIFRGCPQPCSTNRRLLLLLASRQWPPSPALSLPIALPMPLPAIAFRSFSGFSART